MDTRHIKMTIFVQKSPASLRELSQKMLLSTRIVFQFAARTALTRDWRVVNVPDDESGRQGWMSTIVGVVHPVTPQKLHTK